MKMIDAIREWMARHPYDAQGPTYDESDLYELVADVAIEAYELGHRGADPAPRRARFLVEEAGRQWNAARATVERSKSFGPSVPITNAEVAREAVKIATALADALGLTE